MKHYQYLIYGLALLLCCACGGSIAPSPAPASPSPTIAAAVRAPTSAAQPSARPSPTPANPAAQPSVTPANAPIAATRAPGQSPATEPSIFLWPADLPPGLAVAPQESRVSAEGELGPIGMGFYVVTLNGDGKKLVVGGGDLGDVLPLAGAERLVTLGPRAGKLITNEQQREVVFEVARGKLFVYSQGLSEEELLRTAASLQPIDVRELRQLAGAK